MIGEHVPSSYEPTEQTVLEIKKLHTARSDVTRPDEQRFWFGEKNSEVTRLRWSITGTTLKSGVFEALFENNVGFLVRKAVGIFADFAPTPKCFELFRDVPPRAKKN